MKTIIITDPLFLPDEEKLYTRLFQAGIWRLHLRKPGSDIRDMARLIEKIPEEFRGRISLNDHFSLAGRYGIGGIHLNGRNPQAPEGYAGLVSRSCHSLEEIRHYKSDCDYLFLSPIFDSISKQGYTSHFTAEELQAAHAQGLLDDKVIALGGISPQAAPQLSRLGFGGGAMLGYIWEPFKSRGTQAGLQQELEAIGKMNRL